MAEQLVAPRVCIRCRALESSTACDREGHEPARPRRARQQPGRHHLPACRMPSARFLSRRSHNYGVGGSISVAGYSSRFLGQILDVLQAEPRWRTQPSSPGSRFYSAQEFTATGWSEEDERISDGPVGSAPLLPSFMGPDKTTPTASSRVTCQPPDVCSRPGAAQIQARWRTEVARWQISSVVIHDHFGSAAVPEMCKVAAGVSACGCPPET